jgi:hypothetical protein
MNPGDWIALAALVVTIIGAIIIASCGWSKINTIVTRIDDLLEKEIKPVLKATNDRTIDIDKRLGIVEFAMRQKLTDEFAPGNSPRKLNDKGHRILQDSGIKEVVDHEKAYLLGLVKSADPKNAYDAESVILGIMSGLLDHKPEYAEKLKNWAFQSGTDVQTALLVGGFYLRDTIFPDLGFTLDDIDKKPPQSGPTPQPAPKQ